MKVLIALLKILHYFWFKLPRGTKNKGSDDSEDDSETEEVETEADKKLKKLEEELEKLPPVYKKIKKY